MVKHKEGEDYHGLQKFKFEKFRLTFWDTQGTIENSFSWLF